MPIEPASPLPVDEALPRLLAALSAGNAAVLLAPTGAGKTTRVPPALLAAGMGGEGQIVLLEPRRVAARAAARRIAEEGGWRLGEEVGYQVRFERRAGPATRILVVTEGILVQRLQADPFLTGIAAIVFDEVHERSLTTDLALAMARRVQREVRPDLRLLAMSATLDPAPLAAFLDAPVIESRGRQYPVAIRHLERPGGRPDERPLQAVVAAAVAQLLAEDLPGDLLVFLPGVGEIQRAAEALAPLAAERDLAVLPLYGDLPPERQDEVLRRGSRRKVVLATNVAESSITIDGVAAVIDSGLVRRLRYDPATGLDRLELGRVSRASADQRAGRAGRQGPGVCLRLWAAWEEAALPARETPEIARVDLAPAALQLLAWGETDLDRFGWFAAPDPAALAAARLLLERLGAVDANGVTARGQAMSCLPVHPRLARLLIEGRSHGWPREAALLAALLAERDPFSGGGGPGEREARHRAVRPSRSDLLDRLEALESFERRGRETDLPGGRPLHRNAARFVLQARDQLARIGGEMRGPAGSGEDGAQLFEPVRASLSTARSPTPPASLPRDEALLRALLAAFPDRLARRREPKSPRAVLVGGRGVRLADESAVVHPELFLALDLDDRGAEALVRLASEVEPAWLPPERLATAVELEFDPERERVVAWKRTRYEDLVIAENEAPLSTAAERGEAERLLVLAAAERLDRALPLDDPEVAAFLARVRSLAAWMPELGLTPFGPAELRGLLPTLAAGRRSLAELRRAPLLAALEGALSWEQREALRREAPERWTVPGGRSVQLQYSAGDEIRPPVLAARIQELFGLAETPRVAAGRVPVLLHLLAPNGRPQQITHDLKSFWATTYKEIKKELQGRYPKHAWPEDPWNARPQSRPGRGRP